MDFDEAFAISVRRAKVPHNSIAIRSPAAFLDFVVTLPEPKRHLLLCAAATALAKHAIMTRDFTDVRNWHRAALRMFEFDPDFEVTHLISA